MLEGDDKEAVFKICNNLAQKDKEMKKSPEQPESSARFPWALQLEELPSQYAISLILWKNVIEDAFCDAPINNSKKISRV